MAAISEGQPVRAPEMRSSDWCGHYTVSLKLRAAMTAVVRYGGDARVIGSDTNTRPPVVNRGQGS